MVPLSALWLPILLSAVIVFVASSIVHMVLPYHRTDYQPLPQEEKILRALREAGVQRGLYMFPFCTDRQRKSPEIGEKFRQGPVGMMAVFRSGPPAMGKYLSEWFVYCLIISYFTAYLTGRTLAPGTAYLGVFRVAGTAAFMAFGLGQMSNAIWRGYPWTVVMKEVFDGLIYGLLLAGAFGWLWPH